MIRVAEILHRPIHEVLQLPWWELQLWAAKLAREPAPLERQEYALAYLTSLFINANSRRGAARVTIEQCLLWTKAWDHQANSGDPDVDHDIELLKKAFGKRLVVRQPVPEPQVTTDDDDGPA